MIEGLDIDHWVIKARDGDREAFGKLYDHFLDPIYRYIVFRVSSRETAEDITADVFLKTLRNLNSYQKREGMPFSAWLFRIAKNALIDYYRKNIPSEEIPEDFSDESSHSHADRETSLNIEKRRLLFGLRQLPDMQSQAIALKYFSERSNEEIGAILGKSETAVRILQSRGLKKLREYLSAS
ncbi:sigma-70 family RNA polymerase sigma factor [Candidatus Peregrinibacteria bacterium]|nr:MAG: sigma-70 family RNA polymerase sigma factor [Candidatus Peregrinibacteria bacterium]